ncbi:MAG: tetratricopeptide repeat protein [Candidatus Brocadia sp.]|jgi:glycosyltransferase involved in cell wall biosynthesis/Tfp pilus assembly protein PilF
MPTYSAQKYFNEAQTFKENGLLEKAIASYKKAIEIDPCFIGAHYTLALLYYQSQQFDNAVTHFKKAIELDPNDASTLNNLGVIFYANNQLNEAMVYFEKALLLDANYKEALNNLVKVQVKLQKAAPYSSLQQSLKHYCCKIGFVTLWYERGQAYVTRAIKNALANDHTTFIFARNGGTHDKPMLQTTGEWDTPNLTTHPTYQIPHAVLKNWIINNNLDIVFFNEEYDLGLVETAKECGVKTVGYYVWELFDPRFTAACKRLYDKIICPTKACYEKFKTMGMNNIEYIRWGIDLNLFKPIERPVNNRIKFFHPAGWGGLHARRGTQFVIDAFQKLNAPNSELLIHTQNGSGTQENNNIKIISGTVPRKKIIRMYQNADVAVLPSKWEGLGLTFLEAIGCGLPIITVDAPPMNEFVVDGETGLLCKVAKRLQYPGIFVEGIHVDLDDMAEKMRKLINDRSLLMKMREKTCSMSVASWSQDGLRVRLLNLINNIAPDFGDTGTDSPKAERKTSTYSSTPKTAKPTFDGVKTSGESQTVTSDAVINKSLPINSNTNSKDSLKLIAKDYTGCKLVRKDDGRQFIRKDHYEEPFTVHLVGARWSNYPWGMENELHRALEKLGITIIDTDFRRNYSRLPELFQQKAHVLLVIKGNGIPPELIKSLPCKTILWYQDDIFATGHASMHIAHNGWAFDTVYSFDKMAVDLYRKLGVKDPRWLPLAMSPSVHRKMFLTKKKYDISFIGNIYPNRKTLLERLARRFNLFVTQAFMDDMVKIFNESKIILNVGIGPTGIQQRVFEAMGCGSFLLTNEIPEESRLFKDRVHLVYFNDANIEDLAAYYLSHNEEREAIALAGYREVNNGHTFQHRIQMILDDVFYRKDLSAQITTETKHTNYNCNAHIDNTNLITHKSRRYKILVVLASDKKNFKQEIAVAINGLSAHQHTVKLFVCDDLTEKTDVDVMNHLLVEGVCTFLPDILLILGGKDIYPRMLRKLKRKLNLTIMVWWRPEMGDSVSEMPEWAVKLNKETDICFISGATLDYVRSTETKGIKRGFWLDSEAHIADEMHSVLSGNIKDRILLYHDEIQQLANSSSEQELLNISKFFVEKDMGIVAAPYLERIIQNNKNNLDAYLLLIDYFLKQGAIEKTREMLKNALEATRSSVSLYHQLATISLELGNLNEAEKWFKISVEQCTSNSDVYNSLGQLYIQKCDFSEAEKYLKTGIQEYPDNIPGLLLLGKLYRKQNRIDEAISCFQQCFKVDHNHDYEDEIRGNLEELYSLKKVEYDASKILVSIIMFTFNRAEYLARSLHLFSKQSFPREAFEIIIIDSSSDNTREVIKEAVRKYGLNIRYFFIPPPAHGLEPCISWNNKSVKQARGDVIVWTHPEVLFSEHMLEEFYKPHTLEDKLWVSSRSATVLTKEEQNKIDAVWDKGIDYILANFNLRKEIFRLGYKFWIPILVSFKKNDFLGIGGFTESLPIPRHSDLDLFFRLLAIDFSVHNPPGFQCIHQWHEPFEERGKDILPLSDKTRQIVYEWRKAFLCGKISASKYAIRNEGKEIGVVPDLREVDIVDSCYKN